MRIKLSDCPYSLGEHKHLTRWVDYAILQDWKMEVIAAKEKLRELNYGKYDGKY